LGADWKQNFIEFNFKPIASASIGQVHQAHYDFGASNLTQRISEAGTMISMEQSYWHTPPADALFLHCKIGGLYLLAAHLKARVDVNRIFLPFKSTEALE
jgi:hypothetical protein